MILFMVVMVMILCIWMVEMIGLLMWCRMVVMVRILFMVVGVVILLF